MNNNSGPRRRPKASDLDELNLVDGYHPTDLGNAGRLSERVVDRARFVETWGQFLVYDGGRWVTDTSGSRILAAATEVPVALLERSLEADTAAERDRAIKHAQQSESNRRLQDMIAIARGDARLRVHHDELDRDPWLLNVLNGTVDLRTGCLRPHSHKDLITKQVPVRYVPDAPRPQFQLCLNEWQPEGDVRHYLQTLIGSAATGVPGEHIVFCIGEGANGKSVFFGAIGEILGHYATIPHRSLLVKGAREEHPTAVASLHLCRLAVTSETPEDAYLNEEVVKSLTGRDRLQARKMRQDPWDFAPTHTLIVHSNHLPRIRGTDEGVWRRAIVCPWSAHIPHRHRDPRLPERLRREYEGILAWIVEGAVRFFEEGLSVPATIDAATEAYRGQQDHVGRFLKSVCVDSDSAYVFSQEMAGAYRAWCATQSEDSLSQGRFAQELSRRGYLSKSTGPQRRRAWHGIKLVNTERS